MKFIIQKDDDSVEKFIVLEKLRKHKYIHDVIELTTAEAKQLNMEYTGVQVPIGNIDFVTTVTNKLFGLEKENPIEVPKYLRTEHFLKRDYSIVTWDKIPREGRYFIKDASTLKHFSYTGNLEFFIQEESFEKPKNEFDCSLRLSKEALYVVSEEVDIISEYRVYVIDNKVEAIANYDGSPMILPDTNFIMEVVGHIKKNEKWLRSYTIDLMVTRGGTSIIEIHNFTSCGLYSTVFGDNLLAAYAQGIDYLKNDNKTLEV